MSDLITALAFVFITAGVLLLIANHFGLSPVPFYIIAGLLTGILVELAGIDQTNVIELAQWGIAFLVFVFGIRVDFDALQSVLRDGEGAAIGLVVVVAPISFGIGLLFGHILEFDSLVRNAIYFSVAATLSSTIVGAGLLEEEIRDNLVHGRLASSVHFFDDLLAVALVLVLSADNLSDPQVVTSQIGYGVLFLVAGLLMYRHGFPILVRLADGFEELILMGSISILIAFIAAAEAAGISIVVGAFAAGLAIRSDGAEALGVRNGIESIKDFFVAIFFVTVGALVSIPTLETIAISATLLVLVLVVNPLVLMLVFTYEGYDARTAFLASSSLNQVSEFSLVIAIEALILTTIAPTLFDAIILTAAVTMILTSFTRRHEEMIYDSIISRLFKSRQTRKIDERSHVADDLSDHVVIVGYGRQGRWLVETCERLERDYLVIENDPVRWDELHAECRNYILGDAMNEYTWQRAQLEDATLVISTVDHRPVSEMILDQEAETDVILRAGTSKEAASLLEAGATFVNVPNILAGDQLAETVEAVLDDDHSKRELRESHLETLVTIERYGVASRL